MAVGVATGNAILQPRLARKVSNDTMPESQFWVSKVRVDARNGRAAELLQHFGAVCWCGGRLVFEW